MALRLLNPLKQPHKACQPLGVHRWISPKAFYLAVAVDPLRKEPRFHEIERELSFPS